MSNIRNFCIIAHIDHGKTTLTDRLLEITGTITKGQAEERLMDSNPIEKERGITIKLAPVQMQYQGHILNLIDTPGHVDFSYEVSRSLKACEGAVLVVDATKGVQAQTIANLEHAKKEGLVIIPALNKIDLESSDPERVTRELIALGFNSEEILRVSGKTGQGVSDLLRAIIDRIPAPKIEVGNDLKAFIFNSTFHSHMGVIAFVKVIQGELNQANLHRLVLYASQEKLTPLEIGVFTPAMQKVNALSAGTVGYIATGLKDIRDITVGDTITTLNTNITPIPGYQKPQPMVFMDLYPVEANNYGSLVDALGKLALNDASLSYKPAASPALGHGFRVGFLGILHAEIVVERLLREFDLPVVNTSPSVPYKIRLKDGRDLELSSPADFPPPEKIATIEEPIVSLTIFTPEKYVGGIMELCQLKRGTFVDMQYVADRVQLSYFMPLIELITNFYDRLKSISSGYASVEYEHAGHQSVDAVKVDILLNGTVADALSFIVPRAEAEAKSRMLVEKLKNTIPRMQFEIPIQAAIGGKIIARQTIRAYRKDVEAKLHGGDMTRNKKLLEKQKRGKKRLKQIGTVQVPQEAFTEILKL